MVPFGNCKRGWADCAEQVRCPTPTASRHLQSFLHLFMSPEDQQSGFGFLSLSSPNACLSCSSYSVGKMSPIAFSLPLSGPAFPFCCWETGEHTWRRLYSPLLSHVRVSTGAVRSIGHTPGFPRAEHPGRGGWYGPGKG